MANINLNTSPYYDDFDDSKNYLKILFKPGYAVQARELTQLQTALQSQISNLGKHIFEDGSLVLNGNVSSTETFFLELDVISPKEIEGKYFTGDVSGSKIRVFHVENDSNSSKIYYIRFNGENIAEGETFTSTEVNFSFEIGSVFQGEATLFSIEKSVFFVSGYFVVCNQQTIVLSENNKTFTQKIGLRVEDSIINSSEDQTLLDPSQGSPNFAAPGADRYGISLTLEKLEFNTQTQGEEDLENFIEVARYIQGELVFKITSSFYADLEDNLARRTYDESGDYTVRPFSAKVVENIFGDENKFSIAIGAGKAYVRGYEYETIATQYVDMDRALDFTSKNNRSVENSFGDSFIVNAPTGFLNYISSPVVNILSRGTVIGTARPFWIESLTSNSYRLFLSNFNITDTNKTVRDITSFTSIDSTWNAVIDQSFYDGTVTIDKAFSRSLLLNLPNKNIKTLTDTSYVRTASFSSTINASVCVINTNTAEVFYSSNPENYHVVNNLTGQIIEVTNVSLNPEGTSATLTFGIATAANVTVFSSLNISEATAKSKSLQTTTINKGIASRISLDHSDCFSLDSVIASNTLNPTNFRDITSLFEFNNGQTDELYDHGFITLKAGSTIPRDFDTLAISFRYFTQNTANGFFSVDSYNLAEVAYDAIPKFTSPLNGKVYSLTDCLDFRPRRANNSTTITGGGIGVPNSRIVTDYEYYVPRIDKLLLTKERKFTVVRGVPAETPSVPNDLPDSMTLYVMEIPPFSRIPENVKITYVDNRRYTMRDIGKIDKRVRKIEYYTALSLLEKQAKDEMLYDNQGVEKFKNGILVDSFAGHSVGDVDHVNYSCSIDKQNRILRPRFSEHRFNFVTAALASATQKGDLVTLPYTSEVFVDQPFATGSVNLNPYMVFNWNGTMSLEPATDNWVDTQTKPDVIVNLNGENDIYTSIVPKVDNPASVGVNYGDWQTVVSGVTVTPTLSNIASSSVASINGTEFETTTNAVSTSIATSTTTSSYRDGVSIATSDVSVVNRDLGTKIVDTSIVPYIRSRIVNFSAKNLKPNTNLFASFDNVDVSSFCTPAIELRVADVPNGAYYIKNASNTKRARILGVRSDTVLVVLDANTQNFTNNESVTFENQLGGTLNSSIVTQIIVSRTLKTNSYGDIAGSFLIPNTPTVKFTVGEKIFRLADVLGSSASTAAETKYVALGLSQSTERTIVSTRVASVSVSPTTQINTTLGSKTTTVVTSGSTQITDVNVLSKPPKITCSNESKFGDTSNGARGDTFYELDFGDATGEAGISYLPTLHPVRYTIIYNGQNYTTGFVGSSAYDSRLVSMGLPKTVGLGNAELFFQKNTINNSAILKIENPFDGTDWEFNVLCPVPDQPPVVLPEKKYDINAAQSSVGEGGTAIFQVSTELVEDGTVLYWSTTGTVAAADFVDNTLTGTVTINNGVGIISRQLKDDFTTEGNEQFALQLRVDSVGGTIKDTSQNVFVTDTSTSPAPTYNIGANVGSILEGESAIFTINTTNVANGTVLYWSTESIVGNVTSGDFQDNLMQGTVTVNNGTATIVRRATLDYVTESGDSFALSLYTDAGRTTKVATSGSVSIVDVQPAIITWSVVPSKQFASEGETITFTIRPSSSVPNGKVLHWSTSNIAGANNVAAADFQDNTLTGTVTVNNNVATVARVISNDLTIENTELFALSIAETSGGSILATSASVTIADTSVPASYTIKTDKSIVTEGQTVTFTLNTENVANNTTVYYSIIQDTGTIATSDFSDGILLGTMVVNSGTAVLTKTIASDGTPEASDSFLFKVYTDAGRTIEVATTGRIAIADAAPATTWTVKADNSTVDENQASSFTVTPSTSIANGTVLYWEYYSAINSVGQPFVASSFAGNTLTGTVTINNNTGRINFTVVDRPTWTGPSTSNPAFGIRLFTDAGRTILVATDVVSVKEEVVPRVSWKVTPSRTMPSGIDFSPNSVSITEQYAFSEGNRVYFYVEAAGQDGNPTIAWEVIHGTTTDADFKAGTLPAGNFTFTSTSGNLDNNYFFVDIATNSEENNFNPEELESFRVKLFYPSNPSATLATSGNVTIAANSQPVIPSPSWRVTYDFETLTGNKAWSAYGAGTTKEGTELTYRLLLNDQAIAEDKKYTTTGEYWVLIKGTVDGSDLVGELTGYLTPISSAVSDTSYPYTLQIKDDKITEGDETVFAEVYLSKTLADVGNVNNSKLIGRSGTLTIKDTSNNTPVYTVAASTSTIREDTNPSVQFTITVDNPPSNTVYWTTEVLSGVLTASDFTDNAVSGSATLVVTDGRGVATVVRTLVNDNIDDHGGFNPDTTFKLAIANSNGGTVVQRSGTISVRDGSQSYYFSPGDERRASERTISLVTGIDSITRKRKVTEPISRSFHVYWEGSPNMHPYQNTAGFRYSASVESITVPSGVDAAGVTFTCGGSSTAYNSGYAPTSRVLCNFSIADNTTWENVSPTDTIKVRIRWTRTQGTAANFPSSLDVQFYDLEYSVNQLFNSSYIDPVAQTFFVESAQYPNGIFVRSVDLFFRTKSTTVPVQVQIRPTVNGFPSSTTILPFATASLEPAKINVSATGSAASTFEFENIVHLSPGEYSIVVLTSTDEYEVFTATLGEFDLIQPSRRITSQPTLGSLFKSQNSFAWTPVQEEDLKFKLNKCVFNTATIGTATYNTKIENNNGSIPYELFFADGEVIDFAETDISYEVRFNGGSWIPYQLSTNYPLTNENSLSTPTSVQFRTILRTRDRNITPVIDLDRLSGTYIHNIVNNSSVGETNAFNGEAIARYITRKVKLANGFDSSDLKVYLMANLPSETSLKVYYKVSTASDTYFDDNAWNEMIVEQAGAYAENSFTEYKYKTSFIDSESRSVALETGERFDTFSVKIVMLSSNPAKVPQIRDLRVIALDD